MGSDRVYSRYDFERLKRLIENSESLSKLDARCVDDLEENFSRSKIIDQKKIKSNIVTMNSRFTLLDIGNGRKEVFTVVFPVDIDSKRNRISVFSPIGTEVLGKKVGEILRIKNGQTESYLQIEGILYQPEAAGDYNL